jgi:PKD repeat protein
MPRAEASAFATCNKGYVGLGYTDSTRRTDSNDFWEYNPATDEWVQIANYGGAARNGACAFTIGKTGYVCVGSPTSGSDYQDLWSYTATVTPAFSAISSICAGQSVSFADTSNFNPDNWLWSFPGGTPSTATTQNPTIQYNTPGSYDVVLSAWNLCDSATKTFTQYVTVGAGTTLTISPATPKVCSGQTITLSVDGGGSTFKWSPSTGLNMATGDSVMVTGPSSVDSVVYSVIDTSSSSGCPSSGQVTVQIGGSTTPGKVTAVRDTICAGTPGNLLLINNSNNIIQWQSSVDDINFADAPGDTLVGYKTNPLTQTTWYRVLVGTGNCSAISDTLRLFVPPALTAYFSVAQTAGNTLTLNSDSSVGNIRSYHWDFGDGNTSTDKNPSHTFTKDTTYYVCLTLYDGSNCSYTFCRYTTIADGVSMISANGNWSVYPNPFGNYILINTIEPGNAIEKVQVYDVLGREVLDKSIEKQQANPLLVNMPFLAQGIYYLKIETNQANYIQKIIKQ